MRNKVKTLKLFLNKIRNNGIIISWASSIVIYLITYQVQFHLRITVTCYLYIKVLKQSQWDFILKAIPTFKLSMYVLKSFSRFITSIAQRFYVMFLFLFSVTNNCEHREKYCYRNICLTLHIIIGDAHLSYIYCETTRVAKQHGKSKATEGEVTDYGIYLWTRENRKKVALLISVTIDFDIFFVLARANYSQITTCYKLQIQGIPPLYWTNIHVR